MGGGKRACISSACCRVVGAWQQPVERPGRGWGKSARVQVHGFDLCALSARRMQRARPNVVVSRPSPKTVARPAAARRPVRACEGRGCHMPRRPRAIQQQRSRMLWLRNAQSAVLLQLANAWCVVRPTGAPGGWRAATDVAVRAHVEKKGQPVKHAQQHHMNHCLVVMNIRLSRVLLPVANEGSRDLPPRASLSMRC